MMSRFDFMKENFRSDVIAFLHFHPKIQWNIMKLVPKSSFYCLYSNE